ncbi:MAG: class I SAM-dependent methyltransferase [Vulcanimicrobiaceae bacterium]
MANNEIADAPDVFLEAVSKAKSGGVCLDAGAGDGWKLRRIIDASSLRRFEGIMAVDYSDIYIEHLRTIVPEANAYVADVQSLPFPDSSVDMLFSGQVIEHVPNDRKVAMEIRRVLRDGGEAVAGSILKLPSAGYYYRDNGEWRIDPTHLREYRTQEEFASVFYPSCVTCG